MSPFDRERLNLLASSTADDLDCSMAHFEECPECGQSIDRRRLGDVLHHDDPGHRPLPVN